MSVGDVRPTDTCSVIGGGTTTTGADGRFELSLLHGAVRLDIDHDWFAQKSVEITVPSREREIVLDRGMTWTGRVLDPDGKNIDRCSLFLTLDGGRILTAKCSPKGFTFATLAPGKAKLRVKLEDHPLGKFRALDRTYELAAGKRMAEDIRWPAGETISGRVVDAGGTPIAGARLTAMPKGAFRPPNQFAEGEVMLEADADGKFTFRHLQPGTWTITGDYRSHTKHTTVDVKTGTTNVLFATPR